MADDPIDPRARVASDLSDRVPDHIAQPIGPPPDILDYDGVLEARRIYRIAADPDAGFHWPYFLSLPDQVAPETSILIEPNNDSRWGAPFETHEYWASILNEQLYFDFGRHLGTPMLTPVFPRPLVEDRNGNLYIHALTRAAMTSPDPRYARPDLQLLAMLDDARAKLAANGHRTSRDGLFWGFSAASDFVTRMAVLHPARVRAVGAGGLGGFPILPLDRYRGEELTFPVGVSDLSQIGSGAFDADAFRVTPILLFQGGADENDSVPEPPFSCEAYGSDSYSCAQALWINAEFGASPVGRVPQIVEIYEAFGVEDFSYLILPDIDHWTPRAMKAGIREYFACVLESETGCAGAVAAPDLTQALERQASRGR